jgi:hypothetical protein
MLRNFFVSLINKDLLCTSIEEDGIKISKIFGQPILLPWESILCMDLSGLKDSNIVLSFTSTPNRRFFLMMIDDRKLIRKACTFTGQSKVWFAAQNVLGLTNITDSSAGAAFKKLEQIAQQRSIKLDGIWLPSNHEH